MSDSESNDSELEADRNETALYLEHYFGNSNFSQPMRNKESSVSTNYSSTLPSNINSSKNEVPSKIKSTDKINTFQDVSCMQHSLINGKYSKLNSFELNDKSVKNISWHSPNRTVKSAKNRFNNSSKIKDCEVKLKCNVQGICASDLPIAKNKIKSVVMKNNINGFTSSEPIKKQKKKLKKHKGKNFSISGKQPLDRLYCLQGDSDIEILSEQVFNSAKVNKVKNASSKFNELIGAKKKKIEEICLSLSDSSDDDAEVLGTQGVKRTKLNGVQSEISEICISSDIESFSNSSSDSSSNDISILKKSPVHSPDEVVLSDQETNYNHPFTFNTSSKTLFFPGNSSSDEDINVSNTPLVSSLKLRRAARKEMYNSLYIKKSVKGKVKSNIIYTNGMKLTDKKPSCKLWTKEMTTFYDCDVPGTLYVEDIHAMQTDNSECWKIIDKDKKITNRRRSFEPRCATCRQFGHGTWNCNRVPNCNFCCAEDHTNVLLCPSRCCYICGGSCIKTLCRNISKKTKCQLCGLLGHSSTVCPDSWRRFHITTSGSVPVMPKNRKISEKKYCSLCCRRGHFNFECNKKVSKSSNYSIVSQLVESYAELSLSEKDKNLLKRVDKSAKNKKFNGRYWNDVEIISDVDTPNKKPKQMYVDVEDSRNYKSPNTRNVQSPKVIKKKKRKIKDFSVKIYKKTGKFKNKDNVFSRIKNKDMLKIKKNKQILNNVIKKKKNKSPQNKNFKVDKWKFL